MRFQVMTHPNKGGRKPAFYVQSKGLHAGRPMKTPKRNSFEVYTDDKEALFMACALVWKLGAFRPQIIGTAIPFMRIKDFSKTLQTALPTSEEGKKALKESFEFIEITERHEAATLAKLGKLKQLARAEAAKYLHNIGFKFGRL